MANATVHLVDLRLAKAEVKVEVKAAARAAKVERAAIGERLTTSHQPV